MNKQLLNGMNRQLMTANALVGLAIKTCSNAMHLVPSKHQVSISNALHKLQEAHIEIEKIEQDGLTRADAAS
jgi:hypothetical protein